ncbi:MAG: hypothetical protein Q3999_05540 [Buchananella hordeovulneris]|nr:hypothetical protein [Buchananella hordeovulneris]
MSWYSAVPEAIMVTVATFAPGLLFGYVARLRGILLLAAAPVFSMAFAGGGAIVAQWLSIPWGWPAYLATILACTALAWLVLWLMERDDYRVEPWTAPALPTLIGAGLAFPVMGLALKAGMLLPDSPAQTYDAVYHLSGLRYIMETGRGSSLTFSAVSNTVGDYKFYPAGWHDLVVMGVRDNPIVGANMMSFVLVLLVLPLGVGTLAARLAPSLKWAGLFGGLLAAVPLAFPIRILGWGTLWPYVASLALVPAGLALSIEFLTTLKMRDWRKNVVSLLLLLTCLFGVGIAHPSGGIVFLLSWLPLLVMRLYAFARSKDWLSTGVLASLLAGDIALLWMALSSSATELRKFKREPTGETWGAVKQLLSDSFDSPYGIQHSFWLGAVLLGLGATAIFVGRRHRWFLIVWAFFGYLWVASLVIDLPGYWLLGPFYFEPQRLAGLAAMFNTILWAVGAGYVAAHIRAKREAYAVGAVALSLIVATGGLNKVSHHEELQAVYQLDDSPNDLVTSSELALIRRSADYLDPEGRVLGSPFEGVSFFYVLNQQPVTHTAIGGSWNLDTDRLAAYLAQEGFTPAACERMERLHVKYMYVDQELFWPEHWWHPYFAGITPSKELWMGGLKLLDSEGTASIYELQGCK